MARDDVIANPAVAVGISEAQRGVGFTAGQFGVAGENFLPSINRAGAFGDDFLAFQRNLAAAFGDIRLFPHIGFSGTVLGAAVRGGGHAGQAVDSDIRIGGNIENLHQPVANVYRASLFTSFRHILHSSQLQYLTAMFVT